MQTIERETQNQLILPKIDEVIRFEYPKSNNLNNRHLIYSKRVLLVTEIRDLCRVGLHPVTIQRRPLKARGRWLITGLCLDTLEERSFYIESMRGFQQSTWLTFGLFDPLATEIEIDRFGVFAPTESDRRFMSSVARRFLELSDHHPSDLSLGIFPLTEGQPVEVIR